MKLINALVLSISLLITCGCMSVRQEDLDAWVGQPVIALEMHPIFLTLPVIKTTTSDGTEIWNYVNRMNISEDRSFGYLNAGMVDFATYNEFTTRTQRFAACHNIFYIKAGVVLRYTPVGTGGARCYTKAQLQPTFDSSTNIR